MEIILLPLLIIAILYSSIGHGGASGYIAIMVFLSIEPLMIKSTALTLNLFVASASFYAFYKGGYFKLSKLTPFVISSIPMAFLGAQIEINPTLYKLILAVCLFIATIRLLLKKPVGKAISTNPPFVIALAIGAGLGVLAGIIGIGGGIILSPILVLMGWANSKESAAISAAFIFLNSSAGLISTSIVGISIVPQIPLWIFICLFGGYLGAYIGSNKLSDFRLRIILAGVLVTASIKLILI